MHSRDNDRVYSSLSTKYWDSLVKRDKYTLTKTDLLLRKEIDAIQDKETSSTTTREDVREH